MYLSTEEKKEIFEKYGKNSTDTGSAEGQIALFTYRIKHLTGHLKENKNGRLVGEKSTAYSYIRKSVSRIAEYNPEVKLIWVFRDPVKRTYSNYWHADTLINEGKGGIQKIKRKFKLP